MELEPSIFYESTIKRFSQYRLRNNKTTCYPEELKEAALSLLNHYPTVKVAQGLGVTATTLRNWLKTKSQEASSSQAEFVPLMFAEPLISCAPIVQEKANAMHLPLTLHLPHGLRLILPEQAIQETARLIKALVKEFSECSI
jgi:transposase-like protein